MDKKMTAEERKTKLNQVLNSHFMHPDHQPKQTVDLERKKLDQVGRVRYVALAIAEKYNKVVDFPNAYALAEDAIEAYLKDKEE